MHSIAGLLLGGQCTLHTACIPILGIMEAGELALTLPSNRPCWPQFRQDGGINQVRVYRWFRTWSSRSFKTYLEAVRAPPSPLSELALTRSLLWAPPRSSFTTSVLEFPTCRRAAVPLSEFVHVDCGTGQHIRVRSACT